MEGCGPCKTAVAALEKAQPMYACVLEIVDKSDPRVQGFGVTSYPTLVVYDENAGRVAHQIAGANNLTEEFWDKAFIVTGDPNELS